MSASAQARALAQDRGNKPTNAISLVKDTFYVTPLCRYINGRMPEQVFPARPPWLYRSFGDDDVPLMHKYQTQAQR